jgi:hypothetical protein
MLAAPASAPAEAPEPTGPPSGRSVGLAVGLVVLALALTGLVWWPRSSADIAGGHVLFDRTSVDGVGIHVEAGDVRVPQVCDLSDPGCAYQVPGILARFASPSIGETGFTYGDPGVGSRDAVKLTGAGRDAPRGAPRQVFVLIRTSPDVALVRAKLMSGAWEEMAPVEGWAVLATQANFDWRTPIEIHDQRGRVTPLNW